MPRWNRREKPDYRHLRDVTDEAALVNAIRSPTYGEEHEHGVMASIQSRILGMFGEADALYLAQLVAAHEAARSADPSFPGHGRDWKSTFVHDVVGNAVGWGMRLGVLREAPNPGGDRLFLLEIRAPLFERMGNGKWRKVDLERSARGAGHREAARVKHAARIEPFVRELVGSLCAKGAAVPDAWFTRYPEQFARLKGLVERVADARTTFEEAHRGMHLADQKAWFVELDRCDRRTVGLLQLEPEAATALPDEDAQALASLQF